MAIVNSGFYEQYDIKIKGKMPLTVRHTIGKKWYLRIWVSGAKE